MSEKKKKVVERASAPSEEELRIVITVRDLAAAQGDPTTRDLLETAATALESAMDDRVRLIGELAEADKNLGALRERVARHDTDRPPALAGAAPAAPVPADELPAEAGAEGGSEAHSARMWR